MYIPNNWKLLKAGDLLLAFSGSINSKKRQVASSGKKMGVKTAGFLDLTVVPPRNCWIFVYIPKPTICNE